MDLLNKEVSHKVFGTGQIIQVTEATVEVQFGNEVKKFVYPDAFDQFLKLHDEEIAEEIHAIIEEKKLAEQELEQKLEEEKELERQKQQLMAEHRKLMKNHNIHPKAQVVFWCDEEEQQKAFTEWQVFTGVVQSGKNKGMPRKLSRLKPNSACLLTRRDENAPEENRQIIGFFMVIEDFFGELREDGYISAHPTYRLQLTEQEANQFPFWKYYINETYPHRITWNSGKHRYFDNIWMAQIIKDVVAMKEDPEEKELAQQFLEYFCKMNQILEDEIPEPSGALVQEVAKSS